VLSSEIKFEERVVESVSGRALHVISSIESVMPKGQAHIGSALVSPEW